VASDFTQLEAFTTDLGRAPMESKVEMAKAIEAGAKEIASKARELILGQIRPRTLPHYANAITSEMTGEVSAEVGPVSGRPQGGMGPGVEFGSSKHGPLPHLFPAADTVLPKVGKDIAKKVGDTLL
jgi:hypothetical protein